MPPSDKPFYNTNLLHLLFAVASVALLAVTVWMIVVDHRREWKEYQRTYREEVAPWLTAAELREKENAESRSTEEHLREKERLEQALRRQEPTVAKHVFQSPFLEALGGPLAVQQYWLPELTIDYHFRDVARFDRCTTCHFGIDKSRPGTSGEPAVPSSQTLHVQLKVPVERVEELRDGDKSKPTVRDVYGIKWAERGILDPAAPTVGLVLPKSVAAMGLLESGDVLAEVSETVVDTRDTAGRLLLAAIASESPELDENEENVIVDVTIRRGLPQPYCTHPATRFVRRGPQFTPRIGVRMYDLPRRSGDRDFIQMGVSHAERPGGGCGVAQGTCVDRQSTLGPPDDAAAVFRKPLSAMPPRRG